MSMLSKNNNMGTASFHEFKKQASFFFKEKIKTARLALTDVTPAQLLTEEATSGDLSSPDTRTLASISKAAFELEDFWRIVEILHNRFSRFDRKNWRISYNSLVVLERLLTHGPDSVSKEFQNIKDVIREMQNFQYIDEKGFNWGLAVRKKSERILMLLENESFLKEERVNARKLSREIKGFGSFCQRSCASAEGILQESSRGTFARGNSHFNGHDSDENQIVPSSNENAIQKVERSLKIQEGVENLNTQNSFSCDWKLEEPETSFKENMVPSKDELHRWNAADEDNPLLERKVDEPRMIEEDHPFSDMENLTTASLLSAKDGILQGC